MSLIFNLQPPRSAHPVIKFTCANQEPLTIENLPFDKYEVESSPLTQFILLRKQPTFCWQVFVANSYKNPEIVHPFGYLKASTNLTCVNLFVMPYNYPVLLPLLDDLFKVHRLKPTPEWRNLFQSYLKTMPAYYAGVCFCFDTLFNLKKILKFYFKAITKSSCKNGCTKSVSTNINSGTN